MTKQEEARAANRLVLTRRRRRRTPDELTQRAIAVRIAASAVRLISPEAERWPKKQGTRLK